MKDSTITLLVGRTIESVEATADEIMFVCTDGEAFNIYHMQSCCESVSIHDIQGGNLNDLIGSPIVEASETEDSENWPEDVEMPAYTESFTWTTHRFKTQAGKEIVVRWLGESNGYYSERVHFGRTHKPIKEAP